MTTTPISTPPVDLAALIADLLALRDTLTAVVAGFGEGHIHTPAMPAPVTRWTGHHATLLRHALRQTQEGFAEHLGVCVRTVAAWNATPTVEPRADLQAVLDTALSRAPADAQARFHLLTAQHRHGLRQVA